MLSEIDFLKAADFIRLYAKKQYRKPEKSDKPEQMQLICEKGREALKEMKAFGTLCQKEFGLVDIKNRAWQNSGYVLGSFWCRGKLPEFESLPVTLSLFIEPAKVGGARARLAVILDYKNSDWDKINSKDKKRYCRIFDKEIEQNSNLRYVHYDDGSLYGDILNIPRDQILNRIRKGELYEAHLSYLIPFNDSKTNEILKHEILEGMRILIPYYQYVCM